MQIKWNIYHQSNIIQNRRMKKIVKVNKLELKNVGQLNDYTGEGYYNEKGIFIKEGVGKYNYSNEIYEGKFVNDCLVEGRASLSNGHVEYKGIFKNKVLQGKGTIIWYRPHHIEYVGDLVKGVKHGKGKQVNFHDSTTYEGNFENNQKTIGKYYHSMKNSWVYQGKFKDNVFHGQGKYVDKQGNVYTGEFVKGNIPNGQILFKNGDKYKGQIKGIYSDFVSLKIVGKGIMTYKNGDVLNGVWKENGEVNGTMNYKDKKTYDNYTGGMLNGIRQGKGVLKLTNGNKLTTEWNKGNISTQHVQFTCPDYTYYGQFNQAWKFHGKGTLVEKNGDKYIGEFSKGGKHGHGRLYLKNGQQIKCNYIQNKENGIFIHISPKIKQKVQILDFEIWENGEKGQLPQQMQKKSKPIDYKLYETYIQLQGEQLIDELTALLLH